MFGGELSAWKEPHSIQNCAGKDFFTLFLQIIFVSHLFHIIFVSYRIYLKISFAANISYLVRGLAISLIHCLDFA
jgi:hypothetical protein